MQLVTHRKCTAIHLCVYCAYCQEHYSSFDTDSLMMKFIKVSFVDKLYSSLYKKVQTTIKLQK
jgi:hypothetical protein